MANSENGEVSEKMIFHYLQKGNILSCSYAGGDIMQGQLLGLVDEGGNINMAYHQVNREGEMRTGRCSSRPEIMADGRIRLYETWKWTSGDLSEGSSILEEVT